MLNHFIQQAYFDPYAPSIKPTALYLSGQMKQTLFHIDCKYTKKKICTCPNFSQLPLKEQQNQRVLGQYLQNSLEGIKDEDYKEALKLLEFEKEKLRNIQDVE